MRFDTLPGWLEWLEQQHYKTIDLGLDRVAEVAGHLNVTEFDATVITVAGTNGKGGFVASAQAILKAHGHRVATYTSPHLLIFNERINLNGELATDAQLLEAFDQVDQCCQGVSLTYFEFTTLAAFYLFKQQYFDEIILEVGLGGRLDAVNIITPDYAVITSIGLDHQEYLGDNRDTIAYEKCGILRDSTPLFCAEIDPPAPLQQAIDSHSSCIIGWDFFISENKDSWTLSAPQLFAGSMELEANGLSLPSQAAAICCSYRLLGKNLDVGCIKNTLNGLSLAGRFQRFEQNGVTIILDVAHNVQAVTLLQSRLANLPLPAGAKRIAVFNMLSDKDVSAIIKVVLNDFDAWFLGELDTPRAIKADDLSKMLYENGQSKVSCSKNIRQAYARAISVCQPGDQIIAFGSFYVVSELLSRLKKYE
jgi:dihydrofolate synthase/folylpolyglutamate synthase